MSHVPQDFDQLDEWALLPDLELAMLFCETNAQVLQRVVVSLVDETDPNPTVVNRENFVALVHGMRRIKHEGARALGDAIIQASDYLDQQQPQRAKEVYERFLSTCHSPFFRDIARGQLKKLGQGRG
jgi:hypothetical protein